MGNCFLPKKSSLPSQLHLSIHAQKNQSSNPNINFFSTNYQTTEFVFGKEVLLTISKKHEMARTCFEVKESDIDGFGEKFTIKIVPGFQSTNTKQDKNVFFLPKNEKLKEHVWEVLNAKFQKVKKKEIEIKNDDIIKLGSKILRFSIVKETKNDCFKTFYQLSQQIKIILENLNPSQNGGGSISNFSFLQEDSCFVENKVLKRGSEKALRCRICLEIETELNPFHNLCKCSHFASTHFFCLKRWLSRDLTVIRTDGLSIYNFFDVKCDVCSANLPLSFQKNGEQQFLFNIELPSTQPYFVIEVFSLKNSEKLEMLIVGLIQCRGKYLIGKELNNDIIIKHPSISNTHGILSVKNGVIFYEDNHSENGSLRLIRNASLFVEDSIVLMQNGILAEVHFFFGNNCFCKDSKINRALSIFALFSKGNVIIPEKKNSDNESLKLSSPNKKVVDGLNLHVKSSDQQILSDKENSNILNEQKLKTPGAQNMDSSFELQIRKSSIVEHDLKDISKNAFKKNILKFVNPLTSIRDVDSVFKKLDLGLELNKEPKKTGSIEESEFFGKKANLIFPR